jgi:hypothetical protein
LFVIVIDVLAALFKVEDDRGLFESLSSFWVKHRLSLFADDIALVVRPSGREVRVALEIFNLFGDASGLKVNYSKSAATMISCCGLDVDSIRAILPCATVDSPLTYLGLPLSMSRLPKAQLQTYIDKLDNRFPAWKGSLLDLAGRAVLVKTVITGMNIYCTMALDLSVRMINALEGLCHGFLWRAKPSAKGGACPWLGLWFVPLQNLVGLVLWTSTCLMRRLIRCKRIYNFYASCLFYLYLVTL